MRKDKRHRMNIPADFMGIPVTHQYRYLGVQIDECMYMKEQVKDKKNMELSQKKS